MTLTFTPSAEQPNMLEAQFTAKDSNVLQYHITTGELGSDRATNVFVHARISASMPWVLIKSLVSAPKDLICAIDVPADVTVRVSTNATDISAEVLTA